MKPQAGPVPLIIETDMFSDVDDVGALALAHALVDDGLAEIRAIGVNTPSRWGVGAVRAVNNHRGHPYIPVGALLPQSDEVFERDYARGLTRQFGSDRSTEPDDTAVRVLRRALVGVAGRRAVIVSIGFFDNLVALLRSEGDDISPLSGILLVREHVRHAVVMGGQFPSGTEFNFAADARATQAFLAEWPLPVVFVGFEVGHDVPTGAELTLRDTADDPVAVAYRSYNGPGRARPSWDLLAVAIAVSGTGEHFELSAPGTVEVDAHGCSSWHPGIGRAHRFVIRTSAATTVAASLDKYLSRQLKVVDENRGCPGSRGF